MFVERPFSLMSRVNQSTTVVCESLVQLTSCLSHIDGSGVLSTQEQVHNATALAV